MTGFQIVQYPKEGLKSLLIVIPAVQATFLSVFADYALHFPLFRGVSALTHQADAGNEALVPFKQS